MTIERIDYTIVIPVYFNEGCLTTVMGMLYDEVVMGNRQYNAEVIFVDDGSGDGSLAELISIQKSYPKIVKIIKFTRNFGQASAQVAGYRHAKGQCVISMSADGQDPVNLINELLKGYFEEGHEIVVCTRTGRDESFFRSITSRFFYYLMKKMTFKNIPLGGFDFFLLGPRALKVFLDNLDPHYFGQGLILWTGFKPKFIGYHRRERITGKSQYTLGKKITFLIDGLLSFSYLPLRLSSCVGIALAGIGFVYAMLVFWGTLIYGNPVKGWAPIIIVVLIVGGFQLVMLGIIGEYLWRTLAQVRNRDMFVIDKVYEPVEK